MGVRRWGITFLVLGRTFERVNVYELRREDVGLCMRPVRHTKRFGVRRI